MSITGATATGSTSGLFERTISFKSAGNYLSINDKQENHENSNTAKLI